MGSVSRTGLAHRRCRGPNKSRLKILVLLWISRTVTLIEDARDGLLDVIDDAFNASISSFSSVVECDVS